MLKARLLAGGGAETLYVDDVFSAYTRTGTGASQVTTTNIDMTQGYMLWSKGRSGATDHAVYDSVRGTTKDLVTNTTAAETTQAQGLTAVSATGHTFGTLAKVNTNAATCVDWVFRKAPKFFDVVTYTGTGAAGLTVSHSLGVKPGMILVKCTSAVSNWAVYHQSIGAANGLYLNDTSASFASSFWNSTEPTATQFQLGAPATTVNTSGATYVAYLFAHDTASDGIVQCGTFTTDGSGMASVTLGWEPQYLLFKPSNSGVQDWRVCDSSRGFTVKGSTDAMLYPNLTSAEYGGNSQVYPTATGFGVDALPDTLNWVYLAIRRPNKPPTLGTQVYQAIARTGTGAAAAVTGVGFAPDLLISEVRAGTYGNVLTDRLRGSSRVLIPTATAAESTDTTGVTAFGMDGISVGTDTNYGVVNTSPRTNINWFFKRAVGVFDQVCYTGTGVAKTEAHNLGVVPELVIIKKRSATGNWLVALNFGASNYSYLTLEATTAIASTTYAGNFYHSAIPTATGITLGTDTLTNGSAATFVAYLFATKSGISKVFSYTGNGSSQTINCGFTTGARFILIKRTDSTGDWYVWDTVRGIIAGNDPHLSLNTAVAEVTTNDSIDPDTSGFIVNQLAATNINVTSATYIGLAFS